MSHTDPKTETIDYDVDTISPEREHFSDGTLGEVSGVGTGMISGGIVGAGLAGPVGAVVGAVLGGALGAAAGEAAHDIGEDNAPLLTEPNHFPAPSGAEIEVEPGSFSPSSPAGGNFMQTWEVPDEDLLPLSNPSSFSGDGESVLPDHTDGLAGLADEERAGPPPR